MSSHSTTERLAAALAYCEVLAEKRRQREAAREQEQRDRARLKQKQPKKQTQLKQAGPLRDHVYIIRAGNGYYKIGISFRPHERVKGLRREVEWARDLKLVHTIVPRNAYGLEQSLHRCFAARRIVGEWFLLTDEDIEWIQTQWPA